MRRGLCICLLSCVQCTPVLSWCCDRCYQHCHHYGAVTGAISTAITCTAAAVEVSGMVARDGAGSEDVRERPALCPRLASTRGLQGSQVLPSTSSKLPWAERCVCLLSQARLTVHTLEAYSS